MTAHPFFLGENLKSLTSLTEKRPSKLTRVPVSGPIGGQGTIISLNSQTGVLNLLSLTNRESNPSKIEIPQFFLYT